MKVFRISSASLPPSSVAPQVTGEADLVRQMTARGFRNILRVVVVVLVFALIQMFVLLRVCDEGMQAAATLEDQGLPNLNHLSVLREQLILFRLYSYEYVFAWQNKRPQQARAALAAEQHVQAELAVIKQLLRSPQGQQLTGALDEKFQHLAHEFTQVRTLVDKDFYSSMSVLDRDLPPAIQAVDQAADELERFGYQFSNVQVQANFDSFGWIKHKAVAFGVTNVLVVLGLVAFVQLAARRTRRQLGEALEQLHQQSKILRLQTSALEATANGIVITDCQGVIQWVNPAFTRLTGFTAAEATGNTPRVLKSGEHPAAFYAEMWQTVKSGQAWIGELVNRRKDGSLYHEEMTITPVRDETGHIQNFIAVKHDISNRKRAQRELEHEKKLLGSLMDNLPDFIYFKDSESRFTRVNLAQARHLGLQTPAEAVGKTDADFFPPGEARQKLVDERCLMVVGKPILGLVEKLPTASGVKWVSSSKVPIYGEDGQVAGLVGISHDITERKRAEEDLQRKTTILEAQLNASIDGILVVDELGKKLLQNRRLVDLLHIPQPLADDKDDENQRIWVAQMVKNPDQFIAKIQYLNEHREEISRDEIELNNGTTLDRYSAPMVGRGGKYYGRMWTFRDITERKRAEADRQQMELQLRQSQKLESIGQLAAGIAHEINTPTQYVGDNAQFLKTAIGSLVSMVCEYNELLAAVKAGPVPPEQVARLEADYARRDIKYLFAQIPAAIEESLEGVERISKIVRAMKDFSHPGSQEQELSDLNQAIESTATVARTEWKYVAELELILAPDLPLVPCFLGEFNQVILNLVVNAAHAIADVVRPLPGTKGRITLRTLLAGEWVEVRVSDTGTGIAEPHRSKIFEPFFTTKDVGKGTGQGLSVVYASIVKKHGGTVNFETEVGVGTTFILRLPLHPVAASPPDPRMLAAL